MDSVRLAPIADLFPYTTVMFADISSFTTFGVRSEMSQHKSFSYWEPFIEPLIMLQGNERFSKVETIGDCFMLQ
jgi:hypothetical protein